MDYISENEIIDNITNVWHYDLHKLTDFFKKVNNSGVLSTRVIIELVKLCCIRYTPLTVIKCIDYDDVNVYIDMAQSNIVHGRNKVKFFTNKLIKSKLSDLDKLKCGIRFVSLDVINAYIHLIDLVDVNVFGETFAFIDSLASCDEMTNQSENKTRDNYAQLIYIMCANKITFTNTMIDLMCKIIWQWFKYDHFVKMIPIIEQVCITHQYFPHNFRVGTQMLEYCSHVKSEHQKRHLRINKSIA